MPDGMVNSPQPYIYGAVTCLQQQPFFVLVDGLTFTLTLRRNPPEVQVTSEPKL